MVIEPINRILKVKQKENKITQRKIAELVGISEGTIYGVFTGKSRNVDVIDKVKRVLDLTTEDEVRISKLLKKDKKIRSTGTVMKRLETYDRFGSTVLSRDEYNYFSKELGKHTVENNPRNKNLIYIFKK